jgi:type IV secretory pathway VirB10-like protein
MKNKIKNNSEEPITDISLQDSPVNIKPSKTSSKTKYMMISIVVVSAVCIGGVCIAKVVNFKKNKVAEVKKDTDAKIEKIDTADKRNFDVQPKAENKTENNESAVSATNAVPENTDASQPITFKQAQYTSLACSTCTEDNTQNKSIANQSNNESIVSQEQSEDKTTNSSQGNKTTKFQLKKAIFIKNQDFIIQQGTTIPLVLKTRIDSTLTGMVIATLLEDISSMNGNINLLDKYTQFIGHYDKSINEGEERLAIVWDRISTPQGVVIDIKSLATDALGGSGINGHINHQYGKRFGGAIMLSLFQDLISAQSNKSNVTNNIQNTQQQSVTIAEQILNSNINIKPILYKNQGEIINAIIDEDLDFSDVYKLQIKG